MINIRDDLDLAMQGYSLVDYEACVVRQWRGVLFLGNLPPKLAISRNMVGI